MAVTDGQSGGLRMITVGDIALEVEVLGAGEPVVIIQTALDASELRPLAEHAAARATFWSFTTTAVATPGVHHCAVRPR